MSSAYDMLKPKEDEEVIDVTLSSTEEVVDADFSEDMMRLEGGVEAPFTSISVDGVVQPVDENKNVNIEVSPKISEAISNLSVSDLNDDLGLATTEYVELVKKQIPTLISQLENDSNYVNDADLQAVRDSIPDISGLANKEYVDDKVSKIPKFEILPVDTLPTVDISTTTVYLLKTDESTNNLYDEYIYVNNRWELLGSANINLDGYAKLEDMPTKVSQLENDSQFATEEQVNALFNRLNSNRTLGFYCIEDVTIIVNGVPTVYTANSNVEIKLLETDVFEIVPTSDHSILSLSAYPSALGTYYPWLEGVKQFSNILFDMNPEDMYTKWSQGNQSAYQVQFAQYLNCIFWSDNPYISDVAKRTNYTLYYTSQLPLCYSTIPDNTFKAFYLAFNVNSDPNWGNKAYRDSFAKANWATQVFSYYGARTIGIFGHDDPDFNIVLPKDCRGLMSAATAIENAGTFDAINTTNFGAKLGSWRDAFGWCSSLRNLYIKNLKVNLNVSWSPLEYDSIYSIISWAANTNKITISVSPYTYNLLSQSDFDLAASKNITIELIKTNYIEDRRLSAVKLNGDGTKVLCDNGTYKTLPTKTSELENDKNFTTRKEVDELLASQSGSGDVELPFTSISVDGVNQAPDTNKNINIEVGSKIEAQVQPLENRISKNEQDISDLSNKANTPIGWDNVNGKPFNSLNGGNFTVDENNVLGINKVDYTKVENAPTKLSDFENDKNFTTRKEVDELLASQAGGGEVNLDNYYTKQETFSKEEVQGLLGDYAANSDLSAVEQRVGGIENAGYITKSVANLENYYTKDSIDQNLQNYATKDNISAVQGQVDGTNGEISKIKSGETKVGSALNADNATYATSAGSAVSSTRLESGTVGAEKQPVYFVDGVPVSCGFTVEKSVPADAKFTDTTYGVFDSIENGLVPKSTSTTAYLRGDGAWDELTKAKIMALIGAATEEADGYMTSTDKNNLKVLVNLLGGDDSDLVVNAISEILSIFENYPEGANLVNALGGKVDKVEGKGLSANDYTNAEKEKLAGVEIGATKTVVDSTLNTSSANAIQNKAVATKIGEVEAQISAVSQDLTKEKETIASATNTANTALETSQNAQTNSANALQNSNTALTKASSAETLAQSVVNRANEGDFDGRDGIDGKDGYTPIKGVDYFDGTNGKDGVDGKDGTNGVSVVSVTKTATNGLVDTYTIALSNGNTSTFTVTNGANGKDGTNGVDGKNGTNGTNGVSCTHSWNGTTLTITSASGTSSANLKGEKGDAGKNGTNGTNGTNGVSITSITVTAV